MNTDKIQQHYQTCSDCNCPLFDNAELNCKELKAGDCKYQNVHLLMEEDEKLDQYLDGRRHGPWRSWHDNGQLYMERTLVNGELHGRFRLWRENGKLVEESTYENDKKIGIHRKWQGKSDD